MSAETRANVNDRIRIKAPVTFLMHGQQLYGCTLQRLDCETPMNRHLQTFQKNRIYIFEHYTD